MVSVATLMPEKNPDTSKYCAYASVKIDLALMRWLRGAAGLEGKTVQEYLSDTMNLHLSKRFGEKPIRRLPPPPRKGRPPKQHDD